MPITIPNPFDAFTPLQKAMMYRVLTSYKNKIETTADNLCSSPERIKEQSLMLSVASFQLDQINELQLLLEENNSLDELAIMPYISEHMKKEKSHNLL